MTYGYSNQWAKPAGSFQVPVTPPTSDPDSGSQTSACFGAEWLPYVLGALQQLTEQTTWIGDETAVLQAQERAQLLLDLFGNPVCEAGLVQTPFWDGDSSDADDQLAPDQQPWYGILLNEDTFQAQIEDWVIAALVAYAGGIHAAIAFLTVAPRFRLAFQEHDLGAIVNIFVDSVLVWTGDTSAQDFAVKYVDIFADAVTPGAPNHEIWIEQASNSQMRVLRKELDPNEVYDSAYRYDSGTGLVQWTPDGGDTWVDAPQSDPRHATGYRLPPLTGSDIQCRAASNMVNWLQNFIDTVLSILGVSSTAIAVGTSLVTLFIELGPFAILFDLILNFASVLLGAGAQAIGDAFTQQVYADLLCILYCRMDNDGQISATALTNIEAAVSADIGGLAATILNGIFAIQGEVGLSNAGVIGGALTYDCSGCDCTLCPVVFDFTVDDQGATAYVDGAYVTSQYDSGNSVWLTASSGGSGARYGGYVVDLKGQAHLKTLQCGLYVINSHNITWEASNDLVSWDTLGTVQHGSSGFQQPSITNANYYGYYQYVRVKISFGANPTGYEQFTYLSISC